jgi:hypothetical protein
MVEIIFYACIVNDGTWWKLEDSSDSKQPVQITVPVHQGSKKLVVTFDDHDRMGISP